MGLVIKSFKTVILFLCILVCAFLFLGATSAHALNIVSYSDTISDSGPNEYANHALKFTLNTSLSPGSVIEVTPPSGFSVLPATSTFSLRNVELFVNGVPRVSGTSTSPGVDSVEITSGSPGFFRYTLSPTEGILSGSVVEFRIGNNTSTAVGAITSFSTTTGTTTFSGDVEPVKNSSVLGRHDVLLQIFDGSLVAEREFVIFLNEKVTMPNTDTTETIPPYRFNGAPTTTIGGTTLNVEISLETDEFAICKYDTASGTPYFSMPNTFSNTGLIFHSQVVPVVPNSLNEFFVRCLDDEGNFNIDDFLISVVVNDVPTGQANTEGDVAGSGTGSGNDGTGDGGGAGGTTGESSGETPLEGGDSGSGGSGGGGGGGSGRNIGDTAGGGFESRDAPYRSGDARVIISGYAYPNSTVGIIVDGNFFNNTRADSAGEYSITLNEIARGVYTFGVYAEGSDRVRSSTFSTSFTVTGARTSELGNINVSPSLLVSPDPVDPGQALSVSGYTLPNASVTIENSPINVSAKGVINAVSDGSGRWNTSIDTSGFSVGTYQIRAKSEQVGVAATNFSEYKFYGVGKEADVPLNADLNRDGSVNLIDFSILLFWWNSDGGDSSPPADINRSGKVDLTDFSILLFNWTG